MKQFDRAELDKWCADPSYPEDLRNCADALALALAVVDAAVTSDETNGAKWFYCYVCRIHNEHAKDCPVLACVEKGLTK